MKVDLGQECGLTIDDFKDYAEGDDIECYRVDWVLPNLQLKDPISNNAPDSEDYDKHEIEIIQ